MHALQTLDLDSLEQEQRDVITAKKKTARPRAVRLLGIISGLKKNEMAPTDLMLNHVPVIPPKFRPFSITGNTFLPGDANELYKDLIEYRRLYERTAKELGPESAGEVYADMNRAAKAVYGYGESPNPKTKARSVKGFFATVTGASPKTSYFQSKMLSKPVDTVGRGVVVPDADLGMDEVGIPESMAWKLYGNYVQRRLVQSGMSPGSALRHVKERTPQALKALESEMPNRPVVMTRSPAWFKFNAIGQTPHIVKGDSIKVNTYITEGLNMDFNGDSVAGSTVITYKVDGEVFQTSFAQFAVNIVGKSIDTMVYEADSVTRVYNLADRMIQVLTIDAHLRPTWAPAAQLTIHTSHGSCYNLLTHTGKKVTATEHHNFAFLNDSLELETAKTEDMAGQCDIYVPAVYNFADTTERVTMVEFTPEVGAVLDDDLAWLMGFFAAEGSVTDRDVTFCCTEEDLLERVRVIMVRTFGTNTKLQDTTAHKDCILREYRGWVTRWFKENCGSGFAGKVVPHFILSAPPHIILSYLVGVMDGDGYVTVVEKVGKAPHVAVGIDMHNRAFIESLVGLAASIGIRAFITQSAKSTRFTTVRADIHRFTETALVSRKIHKIQALIAGGFAPEVSSHDIIPLPRSVMSLFKRAASALRHPDAATRERRERWQLYRPGKAVARLGDHFKKSQSKLTRGKARDFIFSYGSELQDDELFLGWCAIVDNCDIQWEHVEEIHRTEREEVTFDVAVPEGRELFAVSGNLLVHNTASIHLPSSKSAVRDVDEKMRPSKMLWSTKNRGTTYHNPKHEQLIGLSMGQDAGGKKRHFTTEDEAMKAIEDGQIDLNDDIEIDT